MALRAVSKGQSPLCREMVRSRGMIDSRATHYVESAWALVELNKMQIVMKLGWGSI